MKAMIVVIGLQLNCNLKDAAGKMLKLVKQ